MAGITSKRRPGFSRTSLLTPCVSSSAAVYSTAFPPSKTVRITSNVPAQPKQGAQKQAEILPPARPLPDSMRCASVCGGVPSRRPLLADEVHDGRKVGFLDKVREGVRGTEGAHPPLPSAKECDTHLFAFVFLDLPGLLDWDRIRPTPDALQCKTGIFY